MAASTCPDCRKGALKWRTHLDGYRPVDRFACERCGYCVAEEDWHVPAAPMRAGLCRNCCGALEDETCTECGLSVTEDVEVHEELRSLIHPTADRLSCARLASAMGRRLIGLKLATCAAHDGPQEQTARALRIALLRQIGEEGAALSDARQWTVDAADVSLAWATYADELVLSGRKGEAVQALQRAVDAEPEAGRVRASLAALLMDLDHYGPAQAEARAVLEQKGDREATLAALDVLARYVEKLIANNDAAAVRDAVSGLGDRSRRHAAFLCAHAWLALQDGERSRARRELKLARKLQADHPLILQLEARVKETRKGWWSW